MYFFSILHSCAKDQGPSPLPNASSVRQRGGDRDQSGVHRPPASQHEMDTQRSAGDGQSFHTGHEGTACLADHFRRRFRAVRHLQHHTGERPWIGLGQHRHQRQRPSLRAPGPEYGVRDPNRRCPVLETAAGGRRRELVHLRVPRGETRGPQRDVGAMRKVAVSHTTVG